MFTWKFSISTVKQLLNLAIGAFYLFIIILSLAIYFYPGSSHADKMTESYNLNYNFLSDLGLTIVYSGHQNFISSTLFVFATTCVCIGLLGYFLALPVILDKGVLSKRLSQVGSLCGILCGIAFMGVGFTPYNYYPDAHMFAVKLGFQLFLLVMLLHSLAIINNEVNLSKNTIWVYFIFMSVLSFYIYLLNWGPSIKVGNGLFINVVWQKITVVGLSITIFIQSLILKKHIQALS